MQPQAPGFRPAVVILLAGFSAAPVCAEILIAPWTALHRGIDYTQATADAAEGRPQLVNVLRIDLMDPGISFTSNPSNGAAPLETLSQTGSEFLASTLAQAAVNTSFYTPCCSTLPQNKDIIGLAVTEKDLVSPAHSNARAALLIDLLNQAAFVNTVTDSFSLVGVHTALSGSNFVLGVGRDLPATPDTIHPARMLVGLGDRDVPGDNGLLYLVTVDDGLPGVSDGATRAESAKWLFRLGAHTGVNLDGGGSTTMVWRTPLGVIERLNLNGGGTQRSNANNLGIYGDPTNVGPQPQFVPVWFVGLPDNSVGDFSAEDGTSNSPPGSPTTLDDDYYFAGAYPAPVGVVTADEPVGNLERAVIRFNPPNDDTLRFHFNLTAQQAVGTNAFRYSTAIFQQDGQGGKSAQLEVLFNDLVVDGTFISEGDQYTSVQFSAGAAGAVAGANVLTVRQVGGDALWSNFDFHRLEVKIIPLPGDWDGDGDADLDDFAEYPGCFSGPGQAPGFVLPSAQCLGAFDLDHDEDVDAHDFGDFQHVFSQ